VFDYHGKQWFANAVPVVGRSSVDGNRPPGGPSPSGSPFALGAPPQPSNAMARYPSHDTGAHATQPPGLTGNHIPPPGPIPMPNNLQLLIDRLMKFGAIGQPQGGPPPAPPQVPLPGQGPKRTNDIYLPPQQGPVDPAKLQREMLLAQLRG